MSIISFDSATYELEQLSSEAQKQVANLRLVDQEISRLQIQLGIAQTARAAYANVLRSVLPARADQKEPSPLERAMAAGDYLNLG